MVQTRRQYRNWIQSGGPTREDNERIERLLQELHDHDVGHTSYDDINDIDFDMDYNYENTDDDNLPPLDLVDPSQQYPVRDNERQLWRPKRYYPWDRTKRHRKPDPEVKTEFVRPYKRRSGQR